jgi:gamma-glutamylcyclotransferase (GGCT)/AIG2-like uncharacterized protein YtfP
MDLFTLQMAELYALRISYDRKLMDFELPDGSTIQAWIYIMNELPPQAKVISSGDWKNR